LHFPQLYLYLPATREKEQMTDIEVLHFHLFCGLGGGALGFNRGRAELGNLRAKFRCIGGVDNSPAAVRDFHRLTGSHATVLDMFDRAQYEAFHGQAPPDDWREATPDDIKRAARGERPHIAFLSAPCKGFSGLLSSAKSGSHKYQALNQLTLRGIWLMLEAWADDPIELIIFENVPRIATRGRGLLDQIGGLLRHYGYAVAETFHDCGEIGGLAQSRRRFLMVARHTEKVRPFLYEPPKRSLRAVGEILDKFPMPSDPRGGPMHRLPNLQWKTWVRLAFVEAGSDWRSLNRLNVKDGYLADYLLFPERWFNGTMGVVPWDKPSDTVTGKAMPTRGPFSVADPRYVGQEFGQFGVRKWDQPSGLVTSQRSPGQGPFSVADPRAVADPRLQATDPRFNNIYRVVRYKEHSQAISGGSGPSSGGLAVADPRAHGSFKGKGKYIVTPYDSPSNTVIAQSTTGHGSFAVADPRPPAGPLFHKYAVTPWDENAGTVIGGDDMGAYAVADPRTNYPPSSHLNKLRVTDWNDPSKTVTSGQHVQSGLLSVADPRLSKSKERGDAYLTNGHYGVVGWEDATGAVSAAASIDNGRWSVADPRMPAANEKVVALIRSFDGTWHRPFTTLELAALQSLVDPDDIFDLDGDSDGHKRERIGNAVPAAAAQAIADLMGHTLLLAWSGETFALSATPVWVRPVAVALSVKQGDAA
jgi:site-specific DNA-cytosine methylase